VNLLIGLVLAATTATTAPVDQARPTAALERVPIFLHTDARDPVGAIYVARLREALAASSAYRPVMNPAGAQFVVGIVTMDPDEAESASGNGHATAAAVTLRRESAAGLNQFVYSWVLVARRDRVDSMVTELLTAIDKEISGTAPDPGVSN